MITPIIHVPLALKYPTADPCSRRITTKIRHPSQDTWSRHLLIPQGTPPSGHPALSDQLQPPHHIQRYPLQLGMQPPTRRPDNVTENCTIRGATWHSGTRNSGPKHCEICYMPTYITYQTPLLNMLLNHLLDYLYPCCISHCLTQEMRTFLLFCRVQFIAHCVVVSHTGLGSRENIFVFPRSVAAIWLAHLYYA